MKKNKGFTLVEILAVIVILAIIMLLTIPAISGVVGTAKKQSFYLYSQSIYEKAYNKYVLQLNNRSTEDIDCSVYRIDSDDLDIDNTEDYQGWVMVKRVPASSGSYKYSLTLDTGNSTKKLYEVKYCTIEGTECDPYTQPSNNDSYYSEYYDSHEQSRIVLERTLPNNNYALCAAYDYVDDTGHMRRKNTVCATNKTLVTGDKYDYEVTLTMRDKTHAVENALMQKDSNNTNTTFRELFYSYMDSYSRVSSNRQRMPIHELTCDGSQGATLYNNGEVITTHEATTTTTTRHQNVSNPTETVAQTTVEPETTVESVDTSLLLEYLNVSGYDIGFSPTQTSYHFTVPYAVESLNVTARAKDKNAKVEITGGNTLAVGSNVIRVFVHTDDQLESYKEINYYIYVTRQANPSGGGYAGQIRITTKVEDITANGLPDPTLPESNALLNNIIVSGYEFNDPFVPKTFEYDIEIPKSVNKLVMTATPQNTNASVTITGNDNLSDGSEIIINVISSNGFYRTTYKIKVHKYDDTDYGRLTLRIITGVLIIILIILGIIITRQKRQEAIIKKSKEKDQEQRGVIKPTQVVVKTNTQQVVDTDGDNQNNN